ncbi:MAG: guanine deaminase [Cyanobacteria bacterium]|nr:guanine deaminase [Cyanobacteriota bacterium]
MQTHHTPLLQSVVGSCIRAVRGRMAHPVDLNDSQDWQYLEDGLLIADVKGNIIHLGAFEAADTQYKSLNCFQLGPEMTLLPGLIDLHTHLPQYSVTGAQEASLLEWLEKHIFPVEASFENASVVGAQTAQFLKALLAAGTTTAAVFLTVHPPLVDAVFQAASAVGPRLITGLNLMDCNGPKTLLRSPKSLLADTEALCTQWHGQNRGKLFYAWMPRFALSCSPELLAGVGALREKYPDVYLHTHLSEQLSEIRAVSQTFPDCPHYAGVYEQFGLLGPKSLFAHSIHLSQAEWETIQESDSSVIHCPSANFFLKSGRFPWEKLNTDFKNIPMGLGSDVGAGPSLCMFDVMRDAQYMQPDSLISVRQLFHAATLRAAHALQLESEIGNFKPGKAFDAIVVQTSPSKTQLDEILAELIYTGDDRNVLMNVVQGEVAYCRASLSNSIK